MIVFRLETRSGQGVYGRGYGFKYSASAKAERNGNPATGELANHVGPSEDPLLQDWWNGTKLSKKALYNWLDARKSFYCGFETIAQLAAWFPADCVEAMMKADGDTKDPMLLVVYDIKPKLVRKGISQLMFNMDEAMMVERMPLSELLTMIGKL